MSMKLKNYGCEVAAAPDIPGWLRKTIKRTGFKPALKVPIRMKGMTSKGRPLGCHSNVEYLVHHYGGKRMLGYMVHCCIDEKSNVYVTDVAFMPHSVWITPEGKMVDVTKRAISLNATNLLEDKSIETFIPVTTNENLFLRCFAIPHPSLNQPCRVEDKDDVGNPEADLKWVFKEPKLKSLMIKISSYSERFKSFESGDLWKLGDFSGDHQVI